MIVALTDAAGTERDLHVTTWLRHALRDMGWNEAAIDEVKLVVRRGFKHYHTGRAWPTRRRVVLTFGAYDTYEAGLQLIYHEAAHLVAPAGAHHDERFHRVLADGLQSRWPFIVYGSVRPRQRGGGWRQGRRVIEQLQQHVLAGGVL